MYFPFVSRSRFDDMLREKNTQIGDRDRRIAELEADRRMLLDRICLFGVLLFTSTQNPLDDPEITPCAKPIGQEDQSGEKDIASGNGDGRAESSAKAEPTAVASDPPKAESLESQRDPISEPPDLHSTKAEKLDAQSGVKSGATGLLSPKARALDADPGLKSEATDLHSPTANILRSRRLSFIMRRMNRLAERQYFNKLHPAKTAEQQRDEVM